NEVFDGSPSAPRTLKTTLVAQFREHFDQPFDRKNGKEMFKQHCAICHKLTGEGKDLGPDLTVAGLHDSTVLLTHILDRNRVTENNFIPWHGITKKRHDYYGLLGRTNKETVTLRGLEGDLDFARADIAALHSAGRSLMPDGFEMLGEKTLRDIIGYL